MNNDTSETVGGPATATALATLPGKRLMLAIRLSPGAEANLTRGLTNVLRVTLYGEEPDEIIVAIYLANEDLDQTMDHARRLAQGLADGRLTTGPTEPYFVGDAP